MSFRCFLFGSSLLLACFHAYAASGEDAFQALFNGRNLDGWVLVNTPAETWTVKDGMLVCSGKPIGEIRTQKMYQNFVMEVEWRHMVPGGNAGIFVWADDITARGVPFHRSIEVQVLENAYGNTRGHTTHGDIFPIHGATMTPINGRGGSRAFPTENRSKPSPEWNHYRIECNDGNISLAVNGQVVTRGKDASPRKGYICLESEGGVVHYRNLRIRELPPTPLDAEHVATAHRGFRSLYRGLDLRGWRVSDKAANAWQVNDWVLSFDGSVPWEASKIVADEPLDDGEFICDVRFKGAASALVLHVSAAESFRVPAHGNPKIDQVIEKPGRWNRMSWTVSGGKVAIRCNDRLVHETTTSERTLLGLAAEGKLDVANVYYRAVSAR